VAGKRARLRNKLLILTASLAGLLVVIGLGYEWFRNHATPPLPLAEMQLTHNPANQPTGRGSISSDGRFLAYTDDQGLHIQTIDAGESHDVSLPDDLRDHLVNASWFPDGEKLLLEARSANEGRVLWVTSIFGGAPRKLRTYSGQAKISPNGSLLAFVSRGKELWIMGPNGEDPKKILAVDSGYIFALGWSPTSRRIAFGVQEPNGGEVTVQSVALDGKAPQAILKSALLGDQFSSFEWTPDRRLIFARADSSTSGASYNLWYIRVDPDSGIPSGEPVKLTHWDHVWPFLCDLNKDGNRLLVAKSHLWIDVVAGALKDNGTRLEKPSQVTKSDSNNYPTAWSREGKFLLIYSNRAGDRYQIYRQQLDKDVAEPLSSGPDDKSSAEITGDGSWILYWASPPLPGSSGIPNQVLMRIPTAGGAAERILDAPGTTGSAFHCPTAANNGCVLSLMDKGQLAFYSLDPLKGQGKELARTKIGDPGNWMSWAPSPDGKTIAVTGCDELSDKVRLIDLQTGKERELPTPSFILGGLSWSPGGDAIYGASQSIGHHFSLLRLDLSGKSQVLFSRDDFLVSPIVSPDGRLAFGQQTQESNLYSLENF
jgi:eukaryotic-like serine/threonine-protein kinase